MRIRYTGKRAAAREIGRLFGVGDVVEHGQVFDVDDAFALRAIQSNASFEFVDDDPDLSANDRTPPAPRRRRRTSDDNEAGDTGESGADADASSDDNEAGDTGESEEGQ